MHVKKGDQVVVTAGKDADSKGEVIVVDTDKNRVKVQRRNMVVKHQKPNPLTGAEGARIEIEGWIVHRSAFSFQVDSTQIAVTSARLEMLDGSIAGTADIRRVGDVGIDVDDSMAVE